jgi:LysR family glycine cleavage system transcriptional activator
VDGAIAGGGVVLGRISIAARDLEAGRLVAPFPLALRTRAQYRALCASGVETRPHVAAFLDWLTIEAENIERMADRFDIREPLDWA